MLPAFPTRTSTRRTGDDLRHVSLDRLLVTDIDLDPKAVPPPVAAISTTSKRSNIAAISLSKDQAAQEGVELDDDTLRVARLSVHGLTTTALDPALSHLMASVEKHEYLPMLCG